MLKKFLYILLVAAVLGGGIGYYLWTKPHEDMHIKKADFALAAADFVKNYDDAKYLNKMVEITGTVLEVAHETVGEQHNITLVIETGQPDLAITCPLDPFSGQPKNFQQGQTVRLKGICLGNDLLDRCVIVP